MPGNFHGLSDKVLYLENIGRDLTFLKEWDIIRPSIPERTFLTDYSNGTF